MDGGGAEEYGLAMEPLDPEIFGPASPCFGCSPRHPIGFRLQFARDGETVTTRFVPGDAYQGPPGMMHGGLVTALADEIAAWTIIGLRGRMGFTAAIEARLQAPVRIGVEVVGRGRISSETSRVVKLGVDLLQVDRVVFRGDFTFALLDRRGAERVLEAPLPEAWLRFCR